jgi:FAD/FMN-containing dehydrogenase
VLSVWLDDGLRQVLLGEAPLHLQERQAFDLVRHLDDSLQFSHERHAASQVKDLDEVARAVSHALELDGVVVPRSKHDYVIVPSCAHLLKM